MFNHSCEWGYLQGIVTLTFWKMKLHSTPDNSNLQAK